MFSIGEFSRLCQVTTKTLRHYDTIGLLAPANVNMQTGYRYYHTSQLADMLLIQKLKEYGFSLEDIRPLLKADRATLIACLESSKRVQADAYEQLGQLLARMETDIEQLKKGKNIMGNRTDVEIVERQPVEVLSVREEIAIKDFDQLFAKLVRTVQENGATFAGPPIAIYHSKDFDPECTDVELGFPVEPKSAANRTIGGGTFAMGVHKGAYSGLNQSYMAIGTWMEQNGYHISGAPFEVYLNDPQDTPEDALITEIYFPAAK